MAERAEVVVVGGGAIGGAVAYALSRAGVRVTLLEARRIGDGASGAAAGMLTPLAEAPQPGPFADLALHSLRRFPALAQELREVAGMDIEYVPSGVLRVATSEEHERTLQEALTWQRALGLDLRWLGPEQVRSLEPDLAPEVRGGVFSPEEGHVHSLRLTEALAQAAARLGATVRVGTPVVGLTRHNGRVTGVRTAEGAVAADQVVLAAGSWTGLLAHELGVAAPVRPVKGQILSLALVPCPLRRVVYGSGVGYLVPRRDGSVVVGATQEEVGFDMRVTAQGLAALLRGATQLVPALAGAEVRQTGAGLRPGTPDGLPILGPVPGWEGISIASGHFRNGILLSPITGHLMAELITTGKTSLPLDPFSPGRFLDDVEVKEK
ncbi:MAG: glycine oxidase ThiO [Chloroflexi bacterium]|nr:glycine oxidase ThiO [Chloroflexota bacterium]